MSIAVNIRVRTHQANCEGLALGGPTVYYQFSAVNGEAMSCYDAVSPADCSTQPVIPSTGEPRANQDL
jgi:hypothetical protein